MKNWQLKIFISSIALGSLVKAHAASMDIANEATLLSLMYVPRLNIPAGDVCVEKITRKTNGKSRRHTLYYDKQRLLKVVERDSRNRQQKTITFAYHPERIRVVTHYRNVKKRTEHYIPRVRGEISVKRYDNGENIMQAVHLSADEYQINQYAQGGIVTAKKRYQVQQKRYPAATFSLTGNDLYHTYKYSWEKQGSVMHVSGSSGKLKFAKRDKQDNPLLIKLKVDFDDGRKLRMTEKRQLSYCS